MKIPNLEVSTKLKYINKKILFMQRILKRIKEIKKNKLKNNIKRRSNYIIKDEYFFEYINSDNYMYNYLEKKYTEKLKKNSKKKKISLKHIENPLAKKPNIFLKKLKLLFKKENFIIQPNSMKLKFWNISNLILLIYSVIFFPFFITFNINKILFINIIEVLIDLIFITDFFKNFFLGYYNKNNTLIKNFSKIFNNYLNNWLIFDFILDLPYSIIYIFFIQNTFMKILRILRVLKILKFLKIFRKIFYNLSLNPILNRFILSFLIILLLFHNISLIWIIISINDQNIENWIYENNLQYNAKLTIYITSLYWSIQTIFSVGYGDIGAYNIKERLYAIIIMLIGVFIYSFLLGSINSIISIIVNEKNNLKQKLLILTEIKAKFGIKNYLYHKINNFLKNNKNLIENKEDLIYGLPIILQNELNYIVSRFLIQDIPYFNEKPKGFISLILPHLKLLKFKKGDTIYKEKELGNEIYFLKKGKIVFKNTYNNNLLDVLILRNGSYFGELEYLSGGLKRFHKVVSLTNIEVLSLPFKYIQKIFFKEFPYIGKELIKSGIKRKINLYNLFEDRKNKKFHKRLIEYQIENKYSGNNQEIFLVNSWIHFMNKKSKLIRTKCNNEITSFNLYNRGKNKFYHKNT